MPLFTPDLDGLRSMLGRPWALWFTTARYDAVTLIKKDGEWIVLNSPTDEELVGAERVYQQRGNHVSYDEVRDLGLTEVGAVRYVDDYDDRFTDVFISSDNTPFDRASEPEPIHYPGSS
jgi:hypothetical protein